MLTSISRRPSPSALGGFTPSYILYTCAFGTYLLGGVIYLAKKIIRWWYFTCKKPENIICDSILHVNMFQYFRIPYFTCTFFTKFTYDEYIGPYFLSHVVLWFSPVNSTKKKSDSNPQHFLPDLLTHSWFHSMLFALPSYQFPYIVMNKCFYLTWYNGINQRLRAFRVQWSPGFVLGLPPRGGF
jgi:hypothetical protein